MMRKEIFLMIHRNQNDLGDMDTSNILHTYTFIACSTQSYYHTDCGQKSSTATEKNIFSLRF